MIGVIPRIDNVNWPWQKRVQQMMSRDTLQVFDPMVLDFLQDVSRAILRDDRMRAYPEYVAVGYWLRKANIHQIHMNMKQLNEGKWMLPRGLALHFAPGNVDALFMYSWALSLLSGNHNVIRLSSHLSDQTYMLIGVISEVLEEEKYQSILDRTMVVQYEHDEHITTFLSQHCHIRVIWGGDQTVQAIRALPLSPMATELAFADRFSSVMFKADEMIKAGVEEIGELTHHFYNDAFWFQQMACSSPRLIVWVGDQDAIHHAKKKFWSVLEQKIKEKGEPYPTAINMQRLATTWQFAAKDHVSQISGVTFALPVRIDVQSLHEEDKDDHFGGGMFMETSISSLSQMHDWLSEKDQTLTYYGFDQAELTEFVQSFKGRGIDRIVPVGEALSFEDVWDGVNLLTSFTREVIVR